MSRLNNSSPHLTERSPRSYWVSSSIWTQSRPIKRNLYHLKHSSIRDCSIWSSSHAPRTMASRLWTAKLLTIKPKCSSAPKRTGVTTVASHEMATLAGRWWQSWTASSNLSPQWTIWARPPWSMTSFKYSRKVSSASAPTSITRCWTYWESQCSVPSWTSANCETHMTFLTSQKCERNVASWV